MPQWSFDPALFARTYRRPDALMLLGVDLIPILAVMFLGWTAVPLVFLYWLENLMIGLVTVLRILMTGAAAGRAGIAVALAIGGFFTLHFGMFCYVHGVFLTVFASLATGAEPLFPSPFGVIGFALASGAWMGGIVLLVLAAHLVSFFTESVSTPPMQDLEPNTIIMAPYQRIVVLHIGLFVGFGAWMWLGQPMIGVLALILLRVFWGMLTAMAQRRRYEESIEKVDAVSYFARK